MSAEGLRVLALAAGRSLSGADGLTLLGLVGIADPPREGIDHAIALLKKGARARCGRPQCVYVCVCAYARIVIVCVCAYARIVIVCDCVCLWV
jgi:hypothetical protein